MMDGEWQQKEDTTNDEGGDIYKQREKLLIEALQNESLRCI